MVGGGIINFMDIPGNAAVCVYNTIPSAFRIDKLYCWRRIVPYFPLLISDKKKERKRVQVMICMEGWKEGQGRTKGLPAISNGTVWNHQTCLTSITRRIFME